MNSNLPDPSGSERLPVSLEPGRALEQRDDALGYPTAGYPTMASESAESGARLKLLWLLDIVLKYKILIGSVCAICVLGGFIKTFLATPIYEAATSIQIDSQAPRVFKKEGVQDETAEPFFFQTQHELLRSRSLAERVAASTNLVDEAAPKPAPSTWAKVTSLFSKKDAAPAPEANAADLKVRQANAANMILGGLSIIPVPTSRIVRIVFSSPDPRLAQKISIAVAENFVGATLDRRYGATSYAREFLQERLEQLKLKLQDAEKQVVAYAQKEGIVTADDRQPEASARISAVTAALSTATAERVRNEQLWLQARDGSGLGLPQVMNDKTVQSAREKRAQLNADYQDKLNVLKPAFPEMMQLKSQMTELDRYIKSQIDLVKESLRAQYEASQKQEESFKQKLEELRKEALDLRSRGIEYNILQREVDTTRSLYDGLLQQYKEIGVAGALGTNNISIVDRAQLPGAPVSPSLTKNVMLALILGLIAAGGVIYVLELLDDTFKNPADLEEGLGVTTLGVIPYSKQETDSPLDLVLSAPTSAIAEAYRSLRTALQFSTQSGVPRVLLVTSSSPGEGKSTTSISLAANFAQLGSRVLLIDGDLRNPSIHRYLETENSAGLSNYLTGGGEGVSFVRSCAIENVSVMSAGPLPPNPAELLAGPRMSALLSVAGENFDLVVIDGPPVMGLADAPILSSLANGTLLIVQSGATRCGLVRAAAKRLQFARARLVGTVLSKFDVEKSGYAYGYSYSYAYNYGAKPRLTAEQPALEAAPETKLKAA